MGNLDPGRNSIRCEIKKARDLDEGKALKALRNLADRFGGYPMVSHALGDALYKAYERNLKLDAGIAAEHLEEALKAFKRAVGQAQDCIWSRIKYCEKLSCSDKEEQAIEALMLVDNISEADDPSLNDDNCPPEFQRCTKKDRARFLRAHLERVKLDVYSRQINKLLMQPSHYLRLKGAQLLIKLRPGSFLSYHLAVHSSLMAGYTMATDDYRLYLEATIRHADKAVSTFKTSILISLFRARLLFLLGHFADADRECRRGMLISDPRDPNDDTIDLDHAFRAEGESYCERVSCVKRQLSSLLDRISLKLEDFWNTLCFDFQKQYWDSLCSKIRETTEKIQLPIVAWKVKSGILSVPADALIDYYTGTDISVANRIKSSLNFYTEKKKWNCIVCPVAKCPVTCTDPTAFLNHMCSKHKHIPVSKLLPFSVLRDHACTEKGLRQNCDSYDLIELHEDSTEKFKVLYFGSTQDMFKAHPPWPSNGEECSNMEGTMKKIKQRNERLLKEIKTRLVALSTKAPDTKYDKDRCEIAFLWRNLLKDCELDYREKLVPFIRLFQRKHVLDLMAKHETPQIIKQEDIQSVFWANLVPEMGVQTDELVFLEYLSQIDSSGYGKNLFSDGADQLVLKPKPEPEPELHAYPKWEPGLPPRNLEPQVEINVRKLVVYSDKVPGTGTSGVPALYYASFSGSKFSNAARINCVVTDAKPLQELNLIFNLLKSCQHPNILKPLGVWVCDSASSLGHIIFPKVDGSISEIPRCDLFIEENSTIINFADQGHQALRQLFSAVHYVNTCCETGILHPPFPLQISMDTVYYLKDAVGEYQVFLGWFNTESPSQGVNFDGIVKGNWNSLGACLETVLMMPSVSIDKEIDHLLETLKGPLVNYNDLLWEPGLWVVREKMQFIREVFWSLDSDPAKRTQLARRPCLGLQQFAAKLTLKLKEKNLANSFDILRNKVVAHQDSVYHHYPGPKEEDIGITKSTFEKFLRKEAPEYMLKLVVEIRQFNWPLLPPFRRSNAEYVKWFKSIVQGSYASIHGPTALPQPQQPIQSTVWTAALGAAPTQTTMKLHPPGPPFYPPGQSSRSPYLPFHQRPPSLSPGQQFCPPRPPSS